MRWSRTSGTPSKDNSNASTNQNSGGGTSKQSDKAFVGCMPFLPACALCKGVDLEQRARYPWLTSSCDLVDSAGDVFSTSRRHSASQVSRLHIGSSPGSLSSRAQVKPTTLVPEDSPVRQPSLPLKDSARRVRDELMLNTQTVEERVRAPSRLTYDEECAPAAPPKDEPSIHRSLVVRDSCSQMVKACTQTLDLGSSRFVRPSEGAQFNLLYGANGKPPLRPKSLKLVIRHDRKSTWPTPAPAFGSSTLYMTRRKNKYPNCQIQIQAAQPNASVRRSAPTKWESQMKRAELNIRQSLSLELFGKIGCGQLSRCNVQEDSGQALELLERLSRKLTVHDSAGRAVQLYKEWGEPNTAKPLHTLLAAMEVGVAVACVRYDKMLPREETLVHFEQNNTNLEMGSDSRANIPMGVTSQVSNSERRPVDCAVDKLGRNHPEPQHANIHRLGSYKPSQGQTAE